MNRKTLLVLVSVLVLVMMSHTIQRQRIARQEREEISQQDKQQLARTIEEKWFMRSMNVTTGPMSENTTSIPVPTSTVHGLIDDRPPLKDIPSTDLEAIERLKSLPWQRDWPGDRYFNLYHSKRKQGLNVGWAFFSVITAIKRDLDRLQIPHGITS